MRKSSRVIDSDYQVTPDWLSSTVPYFKRAKVGFVQSPQDYRDWSSDTFQAMCNWEYQGFFKIGMIQRNERNAIIQHGTMTLIRKSALIEVGRWGELVHHRRRRTRPPPVRSRL